MKNAQTESLRKRRLGDFEIIRELGRGGMGIVYEAQQISLNRKVALKVLGTSLGMTSKAVVRFRREAEAAAKLHHTNIVPIYATGEHEGTHFYAMELVNGPSLNLVIRQIRESRLNSDQAAKHTESECPGEATATLIQAGEAPGEFPAGEATASVMPAWVAETLGSTSTTSNVSRGVAESSSTLTPGNDYVDTVAKMIADVADGLEYAHNHGVIHRDMKPSNLLLSPDGRLSINDFGLARMLEQPGMTMTGEFVGSPLYMSPEQIAAGRVALDHRTDIYSLGATLYQLLTLEPPFPGERRDQIIGQILHKEPKPPRKVNKKIPIDLETICLKAMEKDPDRRYQTGAQMAEDLRRFVNRFAISAKRTGYVGRLTKWGRRHPAVAASILVALTAGATAGTFAYNSHLAQQRIIAMELERAKENALLYAMSGQFDAAEQEIVRAENSGASTGWVRLLRGQIALYSGRNDEAVHHVERAVELMPDSTAAYGLLIHACMEAGDEDRSYILMKDLIDRPASSFQDVLLKGLGESLAYPALAIEDMNLAIEMRPNSPLARLIRADAYRFYAMNTGRIEDADAALADADAARSFLPEIPIAIGVHLRIQLLRAHLFAEQGNEIGRSQAMQEAALDAKKLAQFPNDDNARWGQAHFFEAVGQYDQAREALCGENLGNADDQSYLAFRCANSWFNERVYNKALSAYERARGRLKRVSWFVPAYIRMEMTEDYSALLEEVRQMHERGRSSSSGVYLVLDWTVFRLLRDNATAALVAKRWVPVFGEYETEWAAIKSYMIGSASVEETIAACGDHARCAKSYAHYVIAVDLLGKGDRVGAAKHFEACREVGVRPHFAYYWSRTFLERLSDDPTWPRWIPIQDHGVDSLEE